MAHHKRRRPKNRRAGCIMCKPWKANGAKNSGFSVYGRCGLLPASALRKLQDPVNDLVKDVA